MIERHLPDPHETVEVHFDNSDYVNVCIRYGGGDALLDRWRELGDLLAYRPGWHFDVVNDGEALWSLGAFGESRLTVYITDEAQFHCCDHIEDVDYFSVETADVDAWLADRESVARQPSELSKRLLADSDWSLLRHHQFTGKVSWSDGWFIAIVETIPEEAVFGRTLVSAIAAARAMIVNYCGAPETLESAIQLRVEIDTRATSRFTVS